MTPQFQDCSKSGYSASLREQMAIVANSIEARGVLPSRSPSKPNASSTRSIRVCQCEGKDARDRRLVADVTRRVGCALRKMRAGKIVQGQRDKSGAADGTRFNLSEVSPKRA
jgi:hypothetical protein